MFWLRVVMIRERRSRWPRGLRGRSAAARLLEFWALFNAVCCTGRSLRDGPNPCPGKSYWLCAIVRDQAQKYLSLRLQWVSRGVQTEQRRHSIHPPPSLPIDCQSSSEEKTQPKDSHRLVRQQKYLQWRHGILTGKTAVFAVLKSLIDLPRPGAPTPPNSVPSIQFRGAKHAPGSGSILFWETEQTEFGDTKSVYRQHDQAFTNATDEFVSQVVSDRQTAV